MIVSRRMLMLGTGAAALQQAFPAGRSFADAGIRLAAQPAIVNLAGEAYANTAVWSYGGSVPGPEIRVRQGDRVRLLVGNKLAEDTTVHWHGIRLPNAMDGVPGLTQPPIRPGDSFVYEFAPPDAGTFWYHPHADSLQQIGRGLAGAFIVEEREPVAVDRDLTWLLQDWRLDDGAQIAPGFGNRMEAGMSGRIGNTVTINGRVRERVSVTAGERLRLRIVNAMLARIVGLSFKGHRLIVVAYDGQPCEPHTPEDGRLVLGPAMRADVILDMDGAPGSNHTVTDNFYPDLAYKLVDLAYGPEKPAGKRRQDPPRLPANPLPEPDLDTAQRHQLQLQGGMMGGMGQGAMGQGMTGMMGQGAMGQGMMGQGMMGMMGRGAMGQGMMGRGGAAWAINGLSMTGDGQKEMPPLFTLKRGQSCVLALRNETAWWHPMHLHGHSFRVVSRNGKANAGREWRDTVLVPPRESAEIAFVADNPGDWLIHCHVTDHQEAGMMAVLRVA